MRLFRYPWRNSARIALCLLGVWAPAGSLFASYSQAALNTMFYQQDLFLETYLNGYPTNKILGLRFVGGQVFMTPAELLTIGIPVAKSQINQEGLVSLLDIPSLYYNLEQDRQLLFINIDPKFLVGQHINARAIGERPPPSTGFGSVLNYDIFAMRNLDSDTRGSDNRVSSFLDYRLFGNFGLFSQTGILRNEHENGAIRLDSYWSYSDVDSLTTYRFGDTVTGGLAWSRPVRMAGFQMQRNFAIRPDLVTFPVPQASGTASVPSTLDVYINNVRRYSQEVQAGPYVIDNLPVMTGQGEIRLQLRDALGREQVSTLPFYATSKLLISGYWDYSLEGGFLRRNFGLESNNYEDEFSVSGTARYGFTDYLTFEGHSEANENVFNIGGGAVGTLGSWGVVAAGVAVSNFMGDTGGQLSLSYQYTAEQFSFVASTRHASDQYADLAVEMGSPVSSRVNQLGVSYSTRNAGSFGVSLVEVAQNDMSAFTSQPVSRCSGSLSLVL